MKYVADSPELVVAAKDASDVAQLAQLVPPDASVVPLPGAPRLRVVHFARGGNPRELALALQHRLGSRFHVFPVLQDPAGVAVYPTGELKVRFDKRVSDLDLNRFATANRLKLLGRDELAPQQALFSLPEGNDKYLLDVIEAAGKDPRVRLAWPVTLGRYSKA